MLKALTRGEVVGIFPEGGLNAHREDAGYPGIGYLALKTGTPVVPASIVWAKVRPLTLTGTLLIPSRVELKYGSPLVFHQETMPTHKHVQDITAIVMRDIQDLLKRNGAGDG